MTVSFVPLMQAQGRPQSRFRSSAWAGMSLASRPAPPPPRAVIKAALLIPPVEVVQEVASEEPSPAPEPFKAVIGCPLNMLAPPSWKFLVALAAVRHGVSRKDIMGATRVRPVVAARHEAMALVYSHTRHRMLEIGRLFDQDHTCVLNAIQKMGAKALPKEPAIASADAATKRSRDLHRGIRRAYEHGVRLSIIAEKYGCSSGSVKVIAHRMGLKHPRPDLVVRSVPIELVPEYQRLNQQKKIPSREAARMLGVGF